MYVTMCITMRITPQSQNTKDKEKNLKSSQREKININKSVRLILTTDFSTHQWMLEISGVISSNTERNKYYT